MTSTEIKESLKKLVTPYEVLQQIDQLYLEVATTTQLLHDIASQDGWLRTDHTRELWNRLQAWKRDHPTK